MLRKIYDKLIELAEGPNASRALAAVSFLESSVFPIPPDVMLLPMMIANSKKAWYYANICVFWSVLGGLLGYYIGYQLYESVGQYLLDLYGYAGEAEFFRCLYSEYGFWIIVTKGLTPIPFKVVTIVSGVAGFALPTFIFASIVARATRFYMLAFFLRMYGPSIKVFADKHLGWATIILFATIILSFVSVSLFLDSGVFGTTCSHLQVDPV